jgi:hypothetical protein
LYLGFESSFDPNVIGVYGTIDSSGILLRNNTSTMDRSVLEELGISSVGTTEAYSTTETLLEIGLNGSPSTRSELVANKLIRPCPIFVYNV